MILDKAVRTLDIRRRNLKRHKKFKKKKKKRVKREKEYNQREHTTIAR